MFQKRFTKEVDHQEVSSLEMYCVKLPSRTVCFIEEVYTHPNHRKRGHSTDLIREAIQVAKHMHVDCVELTVRQDSTHIKEFYESFGFEDRMQTAMRLKLRDMKPWNPGA